MSDACCATGRAGLPRAEPRRRAPDLPSASVDREAHRARAESTAGGAHHPSVVCWCARGSRRGLSGRQPGAHVPALDDRPRQGCGLRFMRRSLRDHALADENGFLHDFAARPGRLLPLPAARRGGAGPAGGDDFGLPYVWLERPKIHESVFRRMAVTTAGYAPLSRCATFDVVRVGEGQAADDRPAQEDVETVDTYLRRAQSRQRHAVPTAARAGVELGVAPPRRLLRHAGRIARTAVMPSPSVWPRACPSVAGSRRCSPAWRPSCRPLRGRGWAFSPRILSRPLSSLAWPSAAHWRAGGWKPAPPMACASSGTPTGCEGRGRPRPAGNARPGRRAVEREVQGLRCSTGTGGPYIAAGSSSPGHPPFSRAMSWPA